MKKYFWCALVAVGVLTSAKSQQAQEAEPLAGVAAQVLKEGEDASMNGGFAKYLGIKTTGPKIPMKRMIIPVGSVTNDCYVSSQDKQTIVIVERKNPTDVFYLTDLSGKLKRAVINDHSIEVGGLTNIPVIKANADFQHKKEWWIQKCSEPKKQT